MTHVLGAIMAGGRSRRYGRPKALERVAGVRLVDRVADALRAATPAIVMITNDSVIAESAGLRWRSDAIPGLGALAGIHAALLWAKEEDRPGALAVACDMPFLPAGLLQRILRDAESSGADVVVPESEGPRGLEPLCAFYSVRCIDAIEARAAADDRRMVGFHGLVDVLRIPRGEAERFGDIERMFLNVNTPAERERAESMAKEDG